MGQKKCAEPIKASILKFIEEGDRITPKDGKAKETRNWKVPSNTVCTSQFYVSPSNISKKRNAFSVKNSVMGSPKWL